MKYENPIQLGGIRTATMDYPETGGGPGCRVALVDTGSGLRFTVALSRGGDIVDSVYNDTNLAYLSPNGMRPPSHGNPREDDWLRAWPGGLVTTCGPQTIGAPRAEDGQWVPLHGRYSNTPASVDAIENPDPHTGKTDMSISLTVRESRMFGPVYEIKRTISCTLGVAEIRIRDEVRNLSDTSVPHNWLYHINPGYPLLDDGAEFIYKGKAAALPYTGKPLAATKLKAMKRASGPLDSHAGEGYNILFVEPIADRKGLVHAGLINPKRQVGLEIIYPLKQMPRLTNWQHYGPSGSYVTGIEPFYGSLLGKESDLTRHANKTLRPGQHRRYDLTLRIAAGKQQISTLKKHDGPLTPVAVV